MATESLSSKYEGATRRFLAEDVNAFVQQLAALESEVRDHESPDSWEHLVRVTVAATKSLKACEKLELEIESDSEQLRAAQDAYRQAIAPWFDQSWFMERGKTKPKGYPGDFIMLSAIYDRLPRASGIGGYLDQFILASELGRAVPGRMRAVKWFLEEELSGRKGDVSILNLACGPCREFVGGLKHSDDVRPAITVVDSDQETLDWVDRNVSGVNGTPELRCVRHNVLRVGSAKRNIDVFGRPDIVYSVGLFDYIPDRLLVPMLRGLCETLADGGVLYLAFKDADCYDKTPYQWMQDWFFFQRTLDDCRELFGQAGFDVNAMEMTRDETGIIFNFINRLPASERYRVDGAETKPERLGRVDQPASQTADL